MRGEKFIVKNVFLFLLIFFVSCNDVGFGKTTVLIERPCVQYFNKKYVKSLNITMSRFGRRSPYYVNLETENIHTWSNNITVHLVFFEYLSNEYRRSFVEIHQKLCSIIKDNYVGGLLRSGGVGSCPFPPKVYRYMNMTVPSEAFTSVWPFRKAKVEVMADHTVTKEVMALGYGFISLIDTPET